MSRPTSVYQIPCECGNLVESHAAEAVCKKCGRVLVVEKWGKQPGFAALETLDWRSIVRKAGEE